MKINNKTVLVTGGAGAIGSNLVKALLGKKCTVIVVDDLSSGFNENIPKDAIFIHGSITDDQILEKAFSYKPKFVFHLAANFANQNSVDNPEKDLAVNGMGTLKVLEWSQKAGVERFIYSSSSCVYGHKEIAVETDLDFLLDTPYAITKLLGEKYATYFHEMFGMKTVIVRYFNCYGPGELPGKYRNVIPNFIKLAMEGKPLPITGTGKETRDFTFVEDAIAGTIMVAENDACIGKIYNIGTGKETPILDIAKTINKITGNQAGMEFIKKRSWDNVSRRKANISKVKKLGYSPKTSLEEGIGKTHAWIKSKSIAGSGNN